MTMGKSGNKYGQQSGQQKVKHSGKGKKKKGRAWKEKQKLKAIFSKGLTKEKDGDSVDMAGMSNKHKEGKAGRGKQDSSKKGGKHQHRKESKDRSCLKQEHEQSKMAEPGSIGTSVNKNNHSKRVQGIKQSKKKLAEGASTVPKTGTGNGSGKKRKHNTGNLSQTGESTPRTIAMETIVKPPIASSEVSANWKNFLKVMPELGVKKSKKVPTDKNDNKKAEASNTSTPDIWFDDVDEQLLEKPQTDADSTKSKLVKDNCFKGLTKVVAMDCEMVGIGSGGEESMLARVSLVNQHGHCVYDKYVMPTETVTDYRTRFSGIRSSDLHNAEQFSVVQREVSDMIKDRILVGHAIHNDLKALLLDHSRKRIRDTSLYKPFRALFKGGAPALKKLTERVLNVNVQEGEHDSVQDAQATMRLYTMYRQQWEKDLKLGKKVTTAYKVSWEKSRQFQKRKGHHKKHSRQPRDKTS